MLLNALVKCPCLSCLNVFKNYVSDSPLSCILEVTQCLRIKTIRRNKRLCIGDEKLSPECVQDKMAQTNMMLSVRNAHQ